MTTQEDVKIVVSAEDKASTVLNRIAVTAGKADAQVTAMGKSAKSAASGVGNLASLLGVDWMANFAIQARQATNSVKDLSESLKGGGSSATIFKIGLASVAATASYKVGEMIGGWIFQTKRWQDSLEDAIKKAGKLAEEFSKNDRARFDIRTEEIALETNPAERAKQETERLKLQYEEVNALAKRIWDLEADIAEQVSRGRLWMTGEPAQRLASTRRELEEAKARLQVEKEQLDVLQKANGESAKDLQRRKDRMKEVLAFQSLEKQLTEEIAHLKNPKAAEMERALAVTTDDAEKKRIQTLVEEKQRIEAVTEELKKQAEARKDLAIENARREEEEARMRAQSIKEAWDMWREQGKAKRDAAKKQKEDNQSYLDDLKQQLIELKQGKDAAEEFKAAKDGVSQAAIDQGKAMRAEINKLEEEKKKKEEADKKAEKLNSQASSLNALDSRVLSGRSAGLNYAAVTATSTQKTAAAVERNAEIGLQMLAELKLISKTPPAIGIVGGA